jgi:hypothetical protein
MESIQSQIINLSQKVDQIYQILERLTVGDRNFGSVEFPTDRDEGRSIEDPSGSAPRRLDRRYSADSNGYANLPGGANYRYDTAEWVIAGQDLSIDNSGARLGGAANPVENRHQIREQDLSPQIQIQRLTAQLTVAYNRIAALEEQLLARHWK